MRIGYFLFLANILLRSFAPRPLRVLEPDEVGLLEAEEDVDCGLICSTSTAEPAIVSAAGADPVECVLIAFTTDAEGGLLPFCDNVLIGLRFLLIGKSTGVFVLIDISAEFRIPITALSPIDSFCIFIKAF
mmetsp:Transcript_1641/g.2493  ORF Transcript_1641/g.2493 Transcript_1641/m.2493 type:complete len:131 (+) Transcript_1641:118-510(+)